MKRLIALALLGFFPAACTSGQVGRLPTTTVAPVTASKLQLAVGVATLSSPNSTTVLGLNVVETFRNTSGLSATTTNTPTLNGPAGAFGDPGVSAVSGMTLPAQAAAANIIERSKTGSTAGIPFAAGANDDFGNLTGAFGYGFAPDNLADPAISSVISATACPNFTATDSVRYQEAAWPVSVVGTGACTAANATSAGGFAATPYYGGPPLWPSPAGYGLPIGFTGWSSGFSIFVPCTDATCATPATPRAGAYGMSVGVPLGQSASSAYTTVSASAALPASQVAAPLLPIAQPTVTIDGDGTGFANFTVPADPRIYETVVFLTVPDCGLGYLPPAGNLPIHYYAAITKSPGPQSLYFSNLGPPIGGVPTHTFCVSSDAAALAGYTSTTPQFSFTATVVSFDYDAYEASFPANRQPAPAIANVTTGTADLSMSAADKCSNYPIPTAGGTTKC